MVHAYKLIQQFLSPLAQPWPLDMEKGVYVLGAYHSLHCLKNVRKFYIEAVSGNLQDHRDKDFDHALHCYEYLRNDILCQADDTPRYTGFTDGEELGAMQTRMCRSWDKLEDWTRSHTACFRDPSQEVKNYPFIPRTAHCPKGYTYAADGIPTPPWTTGSGTPGLGED